MNHDSAHTDAGFFPGFSADGFFDGFAGLKEAGEGGVETAGPPGLAAKKNFIPRGGDDSHNYAGICVRS